MAFKGGLNWQVKSAKSRFLWLPHCKAAQPDQHLHGILIQVADHGNAAYRIPGEGG